MPRTVAISSPQRNWNVPRYRRSPAGSVRWRTKANVPSGLHYSRCEVRNPVGVHLEATCCAMCSTSELRCLGSRGPWGHATLDRGPRQPRGQHRQWVPQIDHLVQARAKKVRRVHPFPQEIRPLEYRTQGITGARFTPKGECSCGAWDICRADYVLPPQNEITYGSLSPDIALVKSRHAQRRSLRPPLKRKEPR